MSLDLVPDWIVGDLSLTEYPYSVDADSTVDPGDPEQYVEQLESMMPDGDMVSVSGYGNRTYSLTLYIEGASLGEVAEAEAALRRELRRRDLLLTHDPGDTLSVPSAYEVLTSHLAFEREDRHERHVLRKFRLELTCSPFARSVNLVTIPALDNPAVASTITIDTCDSATGWTGTRGSRATVPGEGPSTAWEAGAVGIAELDAEVTSPESWRLVRSGTVDFTATPFLVAEVRTLAADAGGRLRVWAFADGHALPTLEATRLTDGSGYFRVVFDARGLAMSVSKLVFMHISKPGDVWQGLFIRHLSHTNVPPQVSPRQASRVLDVGGTERTPASIHVTTEAETSLGLTIIHTCPEDGSGYSPPLRRWRTAASTGPVTAQPTAFSLEEEPISHAAGGFVAEVPTSALPEGGYVLMAQVRIAHAAGGTATLSWSTSTIFPDATEQQGYTNGSTSLTFPNGDYMLAPVAALSLPSVRTSAGKVQIVLQASIDNLAVYLDEAWLFRADDDCSLSILSTGQPHLWLDSPDVSSSVPRVWVGDGMDTKVHPGEGLQAMGTHVLTPGGTSVFTATQAYAPLTDASYYKRWLHNAAE